MLIRKIWTTIASYIPIIIFSVLKYITIMIFDNQHLEQISQNTLNKHPTHVVKLGFINIICMSSFYIIFLLINIQRSSNDSWKTSSVLFIGSRLHVVILVMIMLPFIFHIFQLIPFKIVVMSAILRTCTVFLNEIRNLKVIGYLFFECN